MSFRLCWLRIWHYFFWSDHSVAVGGLQGCQIVGIWDTMRLRVWFCRSGRELPKYTKTTPHCLEKVVLLWGQKSCFFSFAPKKHLSQEKIGTIHNSSRAIRITLHDLSFVKKWGGSNNLFFQILGILRVSPGPYVMETWGHVYIMIEEVKSNHYKCNKAGLTIWLCK
jgi:hypothetical protein